MDKTCITCIGTGYIVSRKTGDERTCLRCDGTGYYFAEELPARTYFNKTFTQQTSLTGGGGRYAGTGMAYDDYDEDGGSKDYEKRKDPTRKRVSLIADENSCVDGNMREIKVFNGAGELKQIDREVFVRKGRGGEWVKVS